MLRHSLPLVAVALAIGASGCTHCDTCDDFPIPCVGSNCGPLGVNQGSYTPVGTVPAPTSAPAASAEESAHDVAPAPMISPSQEPSPAPASETPAAPAATDPKAPAVEPVPPPAPTPPLPRKSPRHLRRPLKPPRPRRRAPAPAPAVEVPAAKPAKPGDDEEASATPPIAPAPETAPGSGF